MQTDNRHAGADWLKETLEPRGRSLSVFGCQVADLLGELYYGIYHIQSAVLSKKVDWASDHWIQVVVSGDLSTYDSDHLTRLVFHAHERCIRVQVSGACQGYLRLSFSPRKNRDGNLWERHPTLDAAVKAFVTGQR